METYIDILDSLMKAIKEKKKKVPNVKDKEAFRNAWLGLVSESGFGGRAEQYLYEGFSFCGAEPFYAYLVHTKDQNAALETLFGGKCFGNDSDVTFRLITHLLALMLNDNAAGNLLAPIIKRMPETCVKKNKKRLGTAEKIIKKYLLAELMSKTALVPLTDIGTKSIFIKDFVELISSILDSIESGNIKDNIADNIAKIRSWFADYEAAQSTSDDKNVSQADNTHTATENSQISPNADNVQRRKSEKTDFPAEKAPADMATYLVDLLNSAGKAAASIRSENAQQKIKIDTLTHAVEDEREKLRAANQQISDQQDTISALRQKLSESKEKTFVLGQEIAKKGAVIAEKDAEILERIKMIDVLSRDRSKQADETIQRLASKIRIEYRDFVDALDVPMTCDLGENLRLQLQSVFDILEKGGMKIK